MLDSVVSSTDGRGRVFSSRLFPRHEFGSPWGGRTGACSPTDRPPSLPSSQQRVLLRQVSVHVQDGIRRVRQPAPAGGLPVRLPAVPQPGPTALRAQPLDPLLLAGRQRGVSWPWGGGRLTRPREAVSAPPPHPLWMLGVAAIPLVHGLLQKAPCLPRTGCRGSQKGQTRVLPSRGPSVQPGGRQQPGCEKAEMPAGDPGSPRWSFPGPGTRPGTGQVLSEQANWMNGFIPPDPKP